MEGFRGTQSLFAACGVYTRHQQRGLDEHLASGIFKFAAGGAYVFKGNEKVISVTNSDLAIVGAKP
jgi:hypothetical protein